MSDDDNDPSWFATIDRLRTDALMGPAAMLRAADSEQRFLVQDRIPAGGVTMIYGAPGEKKSWLAYELAVLLSQGRGAEWLRGPGDDVPAPGPRLPVLVCNYDNPKPLLGRRMRQLGMQPGDPIMFHSPDSEPLLLPEATRELAALAAGLPIGGRLVPAALVVIDSLREAHTADENDSKSMGEVMRSYKQLCAAGSAVVLIHHAGKAGGGARGSTAIDAACDCSIQVAADVANWTKHRGWHLDNAARGVAFTVADTAAGGVEVRAKKGKKR